jgi:hypothetical protein
MLINFLLYKHLSLNKIPKYLLNQPISLKKIAKGFFVGKLIESSPLTFHQLDELFIMITTSYISSHIYLFDNVKYHGLSEEDQTILMESWTTHLSVLKCLPLLFQDLFS